MGTIDLCDNEDIEACIEEVTAINEEADFEELPLDELILELKHLPSTLKYAFLDTQYARPVMILSQLDHDQEKQLLDLL